MLQYHWQTSPKVPAVKDIPATRTSAVETSSLITSKHPRFVLCEKHLLFHAVFAEDNFITEAFCAEKEISSEFVFFFYHAWLFQHWGCQHLLATLALTVLLKVGNCTQISEKISSLLTMWLNELSYQQQQNKTGTSKGQSGLTIRTAALLLVLSGFHDVKTRSTISADLLKTYIYFTNMNVI